LSPHVKKEVRAEYRERTKTAAHDIMQNDITMMELKKSIKKLKKNKSPGSDNITNKMLQHLCPMMFSDSMYICMHLLIIHSHQLTTTASQAYWTITQDF
jgi:hypothetical protein